MPNHTTAPAGCAPQNPLTLLHSAGNRHQPILDVSKPGAAAGNVVECGGQLALGQRLQRQQQRQRDAGGPEWAVTAQAVPELPCRSQRANKHHTGAAAHGSSQGIW